MSWWLWLVLPAAGFVVGFLFAAVLAGASQADDQARAYWQGRQDGRRASRRSGP